MPWYEKQQPTPFDTQPLAGLTDLHGDLMAQRYRQDRLRGQKYPLISFSSGLQRELTTVPDRSEAFVHIFGALHLPRQANCDEAFAAAEAATLEHSDCRVMRLSDDILVVRNARAGRSYGLRYDNTARELVSVQLGWNVDEMMDLLPGEIRAALPPLYANEERGMQAIAPVKFFTPDLWWTWYPTEFDGEDIMFGLVSGLDVELGYFSVSELESVRGSLGLPVERALYYEPKTLAELKRLHTSGGTT